jgi:hypothetical protein
MYPTRFALVYLMNAISVFYSRMDLKSRFQLTRVGQLMKVTQMRIGAPYLIFAAKTVTTHLGTTVAVHLRDVELCDPFDKMTYYLYLPKRYAKAFTHKDIIDINSDTVRWTLVSKGPDPITKTIILDVESF